ncbi:Septin-2A, partial [Ophiophagus hannah]
MSQSAEKVKFSDSAGYVGFANLPNQVHRKSVKKGFEFTLMVVGYFFLGFINIEASTVEIEERGVKLRLTVVDTPGYGDAINSQNCFKTIIHYIDNQFERYLHDESGLNRRHIVDNRVHCCFYFISPFGHGPCCVSCLRTHMQDLQEVTQDLHYENFRSERLKRTGK